jgi:hypothetical protein
MGGEGAGERFMIHVVATIRSRAAEGLAERNRDQERRHGREAERILQ